MGNKKNIKQKDSSDNCGAADYEDNYEKLIGFKKKPPWYTSTFPWQ